MGALRFLLALSVAYGHAGNFLKFPLVPGDTAVQTFFVISGFYMALVLNEKYNGPSSYTLFMSNRFARLFPTYLAVLAATLVAGIVAARFGIVLPFVEAWRSIASSEFSAKLFLGASQLLIFGQDFYSFLTLKDGALIPWPGFATAPMQLYPLAPIPQAWTLGIEISFYLIAPFIVRRSTFAIAALLSASLALRLYLQFAYGFEGDPWSYRFFPSELALFLAGALGYRVYRANADGKPNGNNIALFAIAILCIGAALLINRWNGLSRAGSVGFLVVASLAIPWLFALTRSKVKDTHLGELSYPIYICHMLVIWIVEMVFKGQVTLVSGTIMMVGTLALSTVLYLYVDTPVDRWRQRRFERQRKRTAKLSAA
ncbi:MAG: acyltransferase [Pseudomonadota bacterium]